MRIVYHLGAHCTDEDRLVRCLLNNQAMLGDQGIVVPSPTQYRKLLRDTAVQLKGKPASVDMQAMVLDQIMQQDRADRLILSWDSFLSFPQWALRGMIYPFAGERIRAFTHIFPEIGAEFHMALRNPATFLPALFEKQKVKGYAEFMEGTDPARLRWSDVIAQIRNQNPDAPLTIWCDEDTPLIWPEVLQAVSGHAPGTVLADTDELLTSIMAPDGLARMRNYMEGHPPENALQRRRIVSAFLEKFALAERVEMEFDLPGWTPALVEQMTSAYQADLALIAGMDGVTVISA